jgi:hypothetical protein
MHQMYALILATIAALAVAAPAERQSGSLPPLPAGSLDGIYVSSVHADGSAFWEYKGPVDTNVTTSSLFTRDSAGVHCNGNYIGNDAQGAANAFRDFCGQGKHFDGKSISVQYGNAVAYGCNYGNGQTCYSGDMQNYFDAIFKQCGQGEAGWYNVKSSKASYGVQAGGSGYC